MSTKVFIISGFTHSSGDKQLKEVLIKNQNNEKTCYMFDDNNCQFYEVMKQTNTFRSFLINNTVIEDGNVYVVTPYDLIFIVLPFFMKKRTQFRTIFDILTDGFDNQITREMIKSIESALNYETVSLIADTKYVNEELFVKFNIDKTLEWLECKLDKIVFALKQNNISVSSDGCKAIGYKTGREDINQENGEYLRMSFEIISRYLCDELCTRLKNLLRLPQDMSESNVSNDSKTQIKRKINDNESLAPFEDYSSYNSGKNTSTVDNKRSKMTRSQKELLKVDKTGMKTISSFFKPKTK